MMMASLLLAVLAGFTILAGIVTLVTFLIFKKEKTTRLKATAEGKKIDKLLADGKISEEEAKELKRAVGVYSITEEEIPASDGHILITGILHIVTGIFMITGVLFFVAFFGTGIVVSQEYAQVTKAGFLLLLPLSFLFILLFLIFLEIIAGIFLVKRRNWARYVIVAYSILILFSFPIGTAIGIYSLWVLLARDGAENYFIRNKEV